MGGVVRRGKFGVVKWKGKTNSETKRTQPMDRELTEKKGPEGVANTGMGNEKGVSEWGGKSAKLTKKSDEDQESILKRAHAKSRKNQTKQER